MPNIHICSQFYRWETNGVHGLPGHFHHYKKNINEYLLFKVEKLDGSILDKTVIEYIEMPLETKQGFMEFSGIQNGLWHSEHWRVLDINKDYFIGKH